MSYHFAIRSRSFPASLTTKLKSRREVIDWLSSIVSDNLAHAKKVEVKMAFKELGNVLQFIFSLEFLRMAVTWTISLLVSHLQLFTNSIFSWNTGAYPRCPLAETPNKQVCIVTGATSGLGAAAAYALSKEGFYVVIVGRSSSSLSKIIREIKDRNKDAHLKAFVVDVASFQSVLKFRDSLQQWLLDSDMHPSVQLLINNAGILATSSRLTAEGYDQIMATNYFGPFSLTKLLLPLLINSPVPSRIVNVTSFTHRSVFNMKVSKELVSGKSFLRSKSYPYAQLYSHSKLCLLLFSNELHRQLGLMNKSGFVSVNTVDPGIVETNIMREVPSCLSRMAFTVFRLLGLLQSPDYGVRSVIDAALAPPKTSGVYFFGGNGRTIHSSTLSYNAKVSEELWTTSSDLFRELQLASASASNFMTT